MDVWVARNRANAERIVSCLREFGFDTPDLVPELFEDPERIIRMGEAPLRIEILTDIDGVTFDDCYARANEQIVDGSPVPVISLHDLKVISELVDDRKTATISRIFPDQQIAFQDSAFRVSNAH